MFGPYFLMQYSVFFLVLQSSHHLINHVCVSVACVSSMRGPRKYFQRGTTLPAFFFRVDEGIQIPLKAGYHPTARETPLKWRFAGVLMMAQR